MEKKTLIITVRAGQGQIIRDAREVGFSELVDAVNQYASSGWKIVAIEELDQSVEEFYSKRLSDDDIDAMAAEVPQ